MSTFRALDSYASQVLRITKHNGGAIEKKLEIRYNPVEIVSVRLQNTTENLA